MALSESTAPALFLDMLPCEVFWQTNIEPVPYAGPEIMLFVEAATQASSEARRLLVIEARDVVSRIPQRIPITTDKQVSSLLKAGGPPTSWGTTYPLTQPTITDPGSSTSPPAKKSRTDVPSGRTLSIFLILKCSPPPYFERRTYIIRLAGKYPV